MKWFANLKIRTKLLVSFSISLSLTLIVGVIAFAGMMHLKIKLPGEAYGELSAWIAALAALSAAAVGVTAVLALVVSSHISRPLSKMVEGANRLAEGDIGVTLDIGARDEAGILARAFEKVVGAIKLLLADTNMIAESLQAGKLAVRADASQHRGEYARIIEGINNSLEAIISPVGDSIAVLMNVSVNDLSEKMSGNYSGDMKLMANAVNATIERMQHIQSVFVDLSRGDLTQLEELEKTGKCSDNDQMMPAIVKTMRTLNELIGDANALSESAANGKLDERCDTSKYEGKYSQLLGGINSVVDAIVMPLNDAMGVLDAMARNDFTSAMSEGYKGSFAALSMSVNSVLETLNQMLSDINAAAEQVTAGTRQVSSGSQALSQGATEQASAIEQLNATVEEIASQTKQNAVNATQASDLATTAKNDAVSGDTLMKELQQAMGEINEASANISKIIKVIDDIAFQTNLLALNAAVEAARAGQHGKGFAVVAEEVRNLAQRSAGAARETTEMIEESIRKAKAGTKIANETAQALNRIVEGVEKATGLIGGIARASSDQATAVSQVNRGIVQVSQVTQTNSATAEESAAASEELSSQAAMLKQMVERFSLRDAARAQGDY
jgi:methyl-accepting chemotaxis protein